MGSEGLDLVIEDEKRPCEKMIQHEHHEIAMSRQQEDNR